MIVRLFRLALILPILAIAPSVAAEPSTRHRTEYRISLLGFPVADAVFNTIFDGERYRIEGRLQSFGLADVLERTRGTAIISGSMGEDFIRTRNYRISYSSGSKIKSTAIDFRDGNVVDTRNQPPVNRREPWVPLQEEHLKGVIDPISALIVPGNGQPPEAICNRTLSVYDGGMRADLALHFKGVHRFQAKGFNGDAVVCDVRFVPVAGYQKGKRSIEFLEDSRDMEIWLAPAGGSQIYAPVFARIPTRIGRLTVEARRYESLR